MLAVAVVLTIALGIVAGVVVTAAAIRLPSVGAVRVGPWRVLADAGLTNINPYLRAHEARTGEVPLARTEGLTALASADGAGRPLDRRCPYRVSGPMPQALFWTLAAVDRQGRPFDNPAGRKSFSTDEIVRDAEGRFAIAVSPVVEPGNWLPVSGTGPFTLVLRLYDLRVSGAAAAAPDLPMPRIEALPC